MHLTDVTRFHMTSASQMTLPNALPNVAGITWLKTRKTHYKFFKDIANYRKFYKILIHLSIVLQRKLVHVD